MTHRVLTTCRACGGPLQRVLDLGETPLANSFMSTAKEARQLERYPLRLCACTDCLFVQLDVAVDSKVLFSSYAYETPRTGTLTAHYERLIREIGLTCGRPLRVVEMGSNNGEFLKSIAPHVGTGDRMNEILGIEPSQIDAGPIPTLRTFFTRETSRDFGKCDLFVARHCMAHLDDLRGTLEGVYNVLTSDGWAVIENAYVMDTLAGAQFDQLYHEHMSYFALRPMLELFESVGLHLRHVLHAPIHGGSIAMFVSKQPGPRSDGLVQMLCDEDVLADRLARFGFHARVTIAGLRAGLREFAFKTIDAYGATAKGSTLLNVLGPDAVHLRYVVDSTPSKIGKFVPGVGVQVVAERVFEDVDAWRLSPNHPPDAYLLTAWNYADEIIAKNAAYCQAGGRFILPFPFPHLAEKC